MAEKALTIDATSKLVSQINDADVLMVGTGIQSNTNNLTIRPTANATNGIVFANASGTGVAAVDTSNGRLRIGDSTTAPLGRLHVASGGGAAGVPPILLTAAAVTTVAVPGALEYDGTSWYITDTVSRKVISAGHAQNTDTGTTNQTFDIYTVGTATRLRADNSGNLQIQTTAGVATRVHATYLSNPATGGGIRSTGTTELTFLVDEDGTGPTLKNVTGGAQEGELTIRNHADTADAKVWATYLANPATGEGVRAEGTTASYFVVNEGAGPRLTDSSGNLLVQNTAGGTTVMNIDPTNQRVFIGGATAPTARLHLVGGGTAASSACLKFTSGSLLSAIENGAIEYNGTHLYISIGGVRYQLDQQTAGSTLTGYTNGAVNWDTGLGVGTTATGTAPYSTVIGAQAGGAGVTTNGSVMVGYRAGYYPNGAYNTSVGYEAGYGDVTTKTTVGCVSLGFQAGRSATSAQYSTCVGYTAGRGITSGNQNTTVGFEAGYGLVATSYNTFVGADSGFNSQSTGGVAIGYQAHYSPDGDYNVAVGYQALLGNAATTSASGCIAIGYQAGYSVSSCTYNTFIGFSAGYSTTTTSNNVAIGRQALNNATNAGLTIAIGNLAAALGGATYTDGGVYIGHEAGYRVAKGAADDSPNIAIGYRAAYGSANNITNNTTAGLVAVGHYALASVDSNCYYSTAVGSNTLYSLTTGSNNVGVGYSSMFAASSASYCTAIGAQAGAGISTGGYNIALGYSAISAGPTTGSHNIAVGYIAGNAMTTASSNILIGNGVARLMTASDNAVVIGSEACYSVAAGSSTMSSVVMLGWRAGYALTSVGGEFIAIGSNAGYRASGQYSIAIGYLAMYGGVGAGAANSNVAIGASALYSITTGTNNVAIGGSAMYYVSSQSGNTAVGVLASQNITGAGSTGNTAVGYYALNGGTVGGTAVTNNTAIGSGTLNRVTTGGSNTAVGYYAGNNVTTGTYNAALGLWAMNKSGGGISTTGSYNAAIGRESFANLTSGSYGIAFGYQALYSLSTGDANVAIGYYAAGAMTSGANNVAIGTSTVVAAAADSAISIGSAASSTSASISIGAYAYSTSNAIAIGYYANATNSNDVAVGQYTFDNMVFNGGGHTAVGSQAGRYLKGRQADTPVWGCTLIGANAGLNLGNGVLAGTAPSYNTVVGADAFRTAVGASVVVLGATVVGAGAAYNSLVACDAFGYNALSANTTGVGNVAFGTSAAQTNQTGTLITAIGLNALFNATTGFNVALGSAAGYSNVAARNNLFVGMNAGWAFSAAALTDTYNTFVGNDAGYGSAGLTTGTQNTFVGYRSAYSFRTAGSCTAVGMWSLYSNLSGSENTAVGAAAAYRATGAGNTCVGTRAGENVTSGVDNIAIGRDAMYLSGVSLTGTGNIAIGLYSLYRQTGNDYNVAIGVNAGRQISTGYYNVALGVNAMGTDAAQTTGYYNFAAMASALSALTDGYHNIAIGVNAAQLVTSGDYNICFGSTAGNAITTGSYNVCVGASSDAAAASLYNIAIGYAATATGASYCYQIGRGSNVTASRCQIGDATYPIVCYGSGAFQSYSDERLKKNIEALSDIAGLTLIEALRPVKYQMRVAMDEYQAKPKMGFIAQQVRDAMLGVGLEGHSIYDDSGDLMGLEYDQFIAPLVKAVQELSAMVKDLQTEVAALKAR